MDINVTLSPKHVIDAGLSPADQSIIRAMVASHAHLLLQVHSLGQQMSGNIGPLSREAYEKAARDTATFFGVIYPGIAVSVT